MSILPSSRKSRSRSLIVTLAPERQIAEAMPAVSSLDDILRRHNAHIVPIQSETARTPGAAALRSDLSKPLSRFHHVVAADDALDRLQDELLKSGTVTGAYIKPAGEPPALRALARAPSAAAGQTPDFTPRQAYLGPAPVGIDALYAWNVGGGSGAGITIIDCEWAWNFSHEDLATHCGGAVVGTPAADDSDHGTAVIGEVIGNANGFGIVGIAPDATLSTACFGDASDQPTSAIIAQAAALLSPGDILLLEIHRPGPNADANQGPQHGFIPIEWWPDDFHAILEATTKGILIVEAGGNGSQNLEDPVYAKPAMGFPSDWTNPFDPRNPQSGAIIVGAGNPPANTHGRMQDTLGFNETYVDRARCIFSNYGARIDCQGWGWEVTTLGYGDLQSGLGAGAPAAANQLYTDVFAGTSSASPIVVGALACVQGVLKNARRDLLTPAAAQTLLRSTGSLQQSAPGRPATQNIGTRPDLRQMIATVSASVVQAPAPGAVNSGATSTKTDFRGSLRHGIEVSVPCVAAIALVATTWAMGWAGKSAPLLSQSPFIAWLVDLGLTALMLGGIGLLKEDSWLGIAIDSRNRLSLSRLQMIAWTILFVATFLVVFIWNIAHHKMGIGWDAKNTGLDVAIPSTVWLLMGMSAASGVAAPFILSQKPAVAPAGAPLPPPAMVADGVLVGRPTGSRPSWSDLIMGEELGNASTIDISKVQQLLLTGVAIVAYGLAIWSLLRSSIGTEILGLPVMSDGFLVLIAASHATYLSFKAVPHT